MLNLQLASMFLTSIPIVVHVIFAASSLIIVALHNNVLADKSTTKIVFTQNLLGRCS